MRSLHDIPLGTQVLVMFVSVAVVASTLTWTLVAAAVDISTEASAPDLAAHVRRTVATVSGLVIVCTAVVALAAAAFLRSSIRRSVQEMQEATRRIAGGDFAHRIESARSDDLGALAGEINAMAARLARLEEARQEFLAGVSHELRTPLTIARGHAFTLRRSEQDAGRSDRLAMIDGEIGRVAALVDDLLTAATLRVRTPRLERRPTRPNELVSIAAGRFSGRAKARGVTVAAEARRVDNWSVHVDEQRIQQVLGNLVDNAVRHAAPGSVVTVSASARRGDVVRFRVRNSGEPISPELARRIFEPFSQGPEGGGAAGLGLAIARELVEAHGTGLHVASRGELTEFWFDLAAETLAADPRAAVSSVSRLTRGYAT